MSITIVNPLIKDEVTFTQTASATNGRTTAMLVKLMPGGGTPMHYHRNFEETFIVLEGELTIALKNRTLVLLEGQEYTVRKQEVHCFLNQSEQEVVFTTIIRPGSRGFEHALCILYGLAADKRTNSKGIPTSILDLAAVSKMSDMRHAGAGKALWPLITVFDLVARMTGTRKRLIKKYCNYSGM